jgi:hypothetical protein
MDNSDLRERLSAILDQEEQKLVDWPAVDQMLDRLNQDLTTGSSQCPHFVWHFIADSDIRAKNAVYADHQRAEVRRFVETGKFVDSQSGRGGALL